MKLVLKGNPLSTNSIYRYTCRGTFPSLYMTHEGKALKESYRKQAQEQYTEPPMKEYVELEVRLFFSTKAKHDLDNFLKITQDSLTGVLYEDDSQIERLTISKYVDKTNPRIEVYVL